MTILFNTREVSHDSWRDYVRGASSIFNLSGRTTREYRFAVSATQADAQAICNDWSAVSNDLRGAIEGFGKNVA